MSAMPTLFVCESNAGPSPMAEAIARHVHPRADVYSAGLYPSHVRPEVRKVLAERGVNVQGLRAKNTFAVPLEEVTLVVRIGLGVEELRAPPQARMIDWMIPDPASYPEDERLDAYRAAADELERRIRALPEEYLR